MPLYDPDLDFVPSSGESAASIPSGPNFLSPAPVGSPAPGSSGSLSTLDPGIPPLPRYVPDPNRRVSIFGDPNEKAVAQWTSEVSDLYYGGKLDEAERIARRYLSDPKSNPMTIQGSIMLIDRIGQRRRMDALQKDLPDILTRKETVRGEKFEVPSAPAEAGPVGPIPGPALRTPLQGLQAPQGQLGELPGVGIALGSQGAPVAPSGGPQDVGVGTVQMPDATRTREATSPEVVTALIQRLGKDAYTPTGMAIINTVERAMEHQARLGIAQRAQDTGKWEYREIPDGTAVLFNKNTRETVPIGPAGPEAVAKAQRMMAQAKDPKKFIGEADPDKQLYTIDEQGKPQPYSLGAASPATQYKFTKEEWEHVAANGLNPRTGEALPEHVVKMAKTTDAKQFKEAKELARENARAGATERGDVAYSVTPLGGKASEWVGKGGVPVSGTMTEKQAIESGAVPVGSAKGASALREGRSMSFFLNKYLPALSAYPKSTDPGLGDYLNTTVAGAKLYLEKRSGGSASIIDAMQGQVARILRSIGEVGNLAQQEQARALEKSIPGFYETQESAAVKLEVLLHGMEGLYYSFGIEPPAEFAKMRAALASANKGSQGGMVDLGKGVKGSISR